MLHLKLAEYDLKTKKFKRFLEIQKDFIYAGNLIYFNKGLASELGVKYDDFCLDKKDPLKRFGGLFNGRTYGKGRFVLIINEENLHEHPEFWKE